MSGAAFLRLKKLKGSGIVRKAARHNRRVIQAEMGAAGSIDPSRSHLNETLRGPPTADDVATLAKDQMSSAGVGKLRSDAVMCVELVFSLPPDTRLDLRAYFSDCVKWAGRHFGGEGNVLSADIHQDEAAPHCHVLILPLRQGRLVGSDMVGNRKTLAATQAEFQSKVAALYGLRNAPGKLMGRSKSDAAAKVLTALRTANDSALRSTAWPALRDAIERDPGPFLVMLGIEHAPKAKRTRTMTQIFTSPGKGPRREPNPIGFRAPQSTRTLCSVGFSKSTPLSAVIEAGRESSRPEVSRVRDDDLDAALYDQVSGEFVTRPERQAALGDDCEWSQHLESE